MMIPEQIYKKTFILCPECKKITDAARGMGIWWNKKCSHCNHKIRVWNMRRSIVTCDTCGNDVVFNALSSMPEYCPSCNNRIQNPVNKSKLVAVQCPTCGTDVVVKEGTVQQQCALCDTTFDVEHELAKKRQRLASKPMLIQCAANITDILWKYPGNSFPRGTQLIVNEGTAAIILQNGMLKSVAAPGSYCLEETSLSLEEKLRSDGTWAYTTDVFFVQERPFVEYRWGTANPYALRDGDRTYTVKARGRLRLCVTDPMQLARNLNFTSLDVSGKHNQNCSDLIGDLVSDQVGMCFGAPLQEIIRAENLHLRSLTTTEIQGKLIAPINRRLEVFGLEIAENTLIIEGLTTEETAISEKDKRIRQAIESPVTWRTGVIKIHMKDNPSRYAEVVLGGSVTPQVYDINMLVDSSLDSSGVDRAARINDTLTGLYNQILQKMIDDTDVDLREINQYYNYLQNTTTDCLNFAFKQYGLSFNNITILQVSFEASNMLRAYFDNEETRLKTMDEAQMRSFMNDAEQKKMLDDENMRRFTQDLRIRERDETGKYEVELLRIQSETEEAKQPYDAKIKQFEADKADREADLQIRKDDAANRIMLNDLLIQQKQKEKEYESEIKALAHKVDVCEMMHKVDQADLNWEQKLYEYSRLCRIQSFADDMDEKQKIAKFENDVEYSKMKLTQAEAEFQNKLKDLDAIRDENKKQADFARELELQSALWKAQFNELQTLMDLEKMRAQLEYLENQNISKAYFEQAKAAGEREYAERLRAQKERDDQSFERRSKDLLEQMRGFKDTLMGDNMRRQMFDSVSKESFETILDSLTTMVDSLANAYGDASLGAKHYTRVRVVSNAAAPKHNDPYSGASNFTPKGIKD